jgi:DNA-binding NarL/FixJ family response regulator
MDQIQILLADDHHLLLDGISSLLSTEPDFNIAAKATDGNEVVEIIQQQFFDVCLLDISMPKIDGIAAARIIRESKPELKIIILTTYNDREIVEELLDIGVSGYLLKNSTRQELADAIRKVYTGGFYFSNEVQNALMQNYVKLNRDKHQKEILLTNRELEILQLLSQEYTNDKIAVALHISFRTVETHRKNLLQKTNSHNLAGLLKYAYSHELIK